MTNVFKIRHGKETHVYRAEAASDKKSLLSQFRHVAEELAAKRRREREGEHERRQTVFDRSAPPSYPDWMADLAKQAGMTGAGDAKNKTESDARWVGDFTDELTVAISLRNFDRAVKLVEEGAYNFIMLASNLIDILLHRRSQSCDYSRPHLQANTSHRLPHLRRSRRTLNSFEP